MSEKNIGWSQLIGEVRKAHYEKEVCQCHYEKYLEWIRVDAEDLAQMEEIGNVFNDNSQEQSRPPEHYQDKYWGKDAKMAFGYYPYYGCRLHKCLHCQRLFFVYREMGGHAGEIRCRYIREELLVFETPGDIYDQYATYSTEQHIQVVTDMDGAELDVQNAIKASENAQKQPRGSSINLKPLLWVLILVFIIRVVSCMAGSGH